MSTIELGCGVATHDEACLCDVIIIQPLPPLEECLKHGVASLFMGPELCELRGYGIPWTNKTLLDFFVDLEKFYDAFHEGSLIGKKIQTLADIVPLEFTDEPLWKQWAVIRETVRYCLNVFDVPLTEIIHYLGVNAAELMDALTMSKNDKNWDDPRLEKLESALMAETVNYAQVARDLCLTKDSVYGLSELYETRRTRLVGVDETNPARAYLHELCRTTTMMNKEIVALVNAKYPTAKYSSGAVSKYRSRIRKQFS